MIDPGVFYQTFIARPESTPNSSDPPSRTSNTLAVIEYRLTSTQARSVQIDPFARPFDHSAKMPISRSKMPITQTAETPVTMEALHVMMTELTSQMRAMMDRFNTRLDEVAAVRSRPSSSISSTPPTVKSSTPPPQLDPPPAVTQQQSNSPAKKKRNKRTRQQYKRRALHVTVQLSVKEVEHTVHTEREPGKHVVLQRIKQVPWDESATSLQTSLLQSWCWHAAIQWNGMAMAMVMVLWCGANGMPRIGIG